MADEDVLRDRQVREQARLLVDDRDAQRPRVRGPADLRRLAVEADRSRVGLMDAGQDLDQRALAGAVLADQAVDLAGQQLQRDVVERLRRPESLRDAAQLGARRAPLAARPIGGHVSRGSTSSDVAVPPAAPEVVVGRRRADLDAACRQRRDHRVRRRRSSVSTASISSVGQKVANAARSHFVWSTMAMTSRAAATIERLICASSSVASASPDSMVNPAAPRKAFWTLIRLNRPSPSWPTTESASQRTRPPSIRTVMPG